MGGWTVLAQTRLGPDRLDVVSDGRGQAFR
jgi:hypothetical protein